DGGDARRVSTGDGGQPSCLPSGGPIVAGRPGGPCYWATTSEQRDAVVAYPNRHGGATSVADRGCERAGHAGIKREQARWAFSPGYGVGGARGRDVLFS